MKTVHAVLLGSILLCPAVSQSADAGPLGFGESDFQSEMETDRPDFTEGTATIERGHLQLEGGYGFSYDRDSQVEAEQHIVPQLLLRVGLLSLAELRIGWQGYSYSKATSSSGSPDLVTHSEGGSDLTAGFKFRLRDVSATLPQISVITELGIPTGSDDVSSNELEPQVKVLWAHDLSERWAIAGNFNLASPVENQDRYLESAGSLTVASQLTDSLGCYLEYFGLYPHGNALQSSTQNYLNGGITITIGENMQFDVLAGFGLNEIATDFFTGAGFAFRI